LSLESSGEPSLVFYDDNRKQRAWLSLGSDGSPTLYLLDRDRVPRVNLGLSENGSPYVALNHSNLVGCASLSLRDDGAPSLEFSDKEGSPCVNLGVLEKDAFLRFGYRNQEDSVRLGLLGGCPGLELFDSEGQLLGAFGTSGAHPEAFKFGPKGAEPVVVLLNRKGEVIFKAPK
jgi:hypothetical protein